jgi:hypothetical protein
MPPKTPEQMQADFLRRQQQGRPQQLGRPAAGMPSQLSAPPVTAQQQGWLATRPDEPQEIQRRAGPSNFVTFGQQLAANQDVALRMAQRAGDQVEDNGASTALLKSDSGRQALLQKAYGQATDLDAAMAGAAAPNHFAQLEQQYGPEAQRRAAEAVARESKRQADAKAKAAADAEAAARREPYLEMQRQADAQRNEASRIRSEDANRPRGQMGKERWANLHGLTLEQWVANGQQPPF